jgi:hypothetical protein
MSQPEIELTVAQQIDPGMMLAHQLSEQGRNVSILNIDSTRIYSGNRVAALVMLGASLGIVGGMANDVFGDNNRTAYADKICVGTNPDGSCAEWIDIDVPTPTQPPNPTPTKPSPTSPSLTPTPTTIPDSDSDGLRNNVDNCDNVQNADQANFDGDADGDVCDPDIDNDGILNENDANNYSSDNDVDGLHDAFDPDSTNSDVDGDGFLDGDATELEDKAGDGTQDLFQSRIDIDGDSYSAETGDTDESDACIPSLDAANCDQDSDGLTYEEEMLLGTDVELTDTDEDGVDDKKDKEPLSKKGVEVDKFGVEVPATTTSSTSSSTTTTEQIDTEEPEEATNTTIEQVIAEANEDSTDGESGVNALLPIGFGGLGLLGIGGLWFVTRRRRDDSDQDTGDVKSGFSGTDTTPIVSN